MPLKTRFICGAHFAPRQERALWAKVQRPEVNGRYYLMPELPEVETVKLGLKKLVIDKTITNVTFDTEKSFPNAPADVRQSLVGAKIVEVKRRAKVLIIELDTKYSLLIHLKMTGQLVFVGKERFGAGHPNDSLIGELPDKSTRVTLDLDNAKLYFNDQRKFGWVKLLPTPEIPNIDFMKKLGPEPLDANFSATNFRERLQRRNNSKVKAVLLDQSVIAGVGNIYADESLWAAKIHPESLVRSIPATKMNTLFTELQAVFRLSIEKGGSSDREQVLSRASKGKIGSYISFAKVFRREGQPCMRCGAVIQKIRVAGRGTHVCEHCQRRPQ